jgi:septal ring factor EnvC (AmiA/AmiB activator)
MLNSLETWLLNKVKNPTTFWAKVAAGACVLLLGAVFIIKYRYNKEQMEILKTKEVLSEDDKKDVVLQEKLKTIREKKSSLIKEVIKSDSNINKVDGNLDKTKKEAISDIEFVEALDDWDEVDKKIR